MKILRRLLRLPLPGFIRKRELKKLLSATASALGSPVPPTAGLSADECLEVFAGFTTAEFGGISGSGVGALREGLFAAAQTLGRRYRALFSVSSVEEAMEVDALLYRSLAIDLRPSAPREMTVRRCFFSSCYTPAICRVASALDEGLFDGLSGGWSLRFAQRLTEGRECCLARVTFGGDPP